MKIIYEFEYLLAYIVLLMILYEILTTILKLRCEC